MAKENAVVAVFDTHDKAEAAVRDLQKASIDMKRISIVGKDYHTEEHVVGYYNTGDRVKAWGKRGAFWGGLWGMLFGGAFFFVPGLGPIMLAGPIVSWLIGALETAAVVGGFSALGGALFSIGIPKDSVIRYESAVKAGKFVLLVHGTADEVARAKGVLDKGGPAEVTVHAP